MKGDKVLSLLGMAQKAGRISGGSFQVSESVKSGAASLVIIASDISEGSEKKYRSEEQYRDMCSYYEVPLYKYSDMDSLGHAIGKEYRAAVSVNDAGFAKGLMKQLNSADTGGSQINGNENQ